MIFLLVGLLIGGIILIITSVYCDQETSHDMIAGVTMILGVIVIVVFIIFLVFAIMAVNESKFWNKKFDTSYTAEEWMFNSSVIKGEKYEIKDEKIHLQIEGLK